jgi:SAM-dependent methyltransferase
MDEVLVAAGNADMAAAWDGDEGEHWAANAERYEEGPQRFSAALFGALDLHDRSAVVDVGCGNGSLSLDIARVARSGSVLGVDLSSRMLDRARANAAAEGLDHVRFERTDAQVHPFEAGAYDLVVSSFGVMFFADPVAAFENLRRALAPNAAVAMLAWRDLERNEWLMKIRAALAVGRDLPVPPPDAPSPFSLADRDRTTGYLTAAGYTDVELTSLDEPMHIGSDAADAYAFVSRFGVTRGLTEDLDEATRKKALDRLRQTFEEHDSADGVHFAGSAWLITARNAGVS